MDAFISAKAGLVAFIRGDQTSVFNVNNLETELVYPIASMRYLFAGANDIKKVNGASKEKSIRMLQKECNKSRALTLTLILLDEKEENETVILATDCLMELFTDEDVLTYVENTLYSNVMPDNANLVRAKECVKSIDKLLSILESVEQHSIEIETLRGRWDNLPDTVFNDYLDKIQYEELLISSGAFKDLVFALNDYKKFSLAYVTCLRLLAQFRNSREVVEYWLSSLMPHKIKESNLPKAVVSDYTHKKVFKSFRPKLTPHEAFENAKKQKAAIVSLLRTGDWAKTRRYVDELIDSQSVHSDPEHISKSLCDLSQQAKLVKNYSLQLELAKRAVEISDDDGWAYCQTAESYFCLNQFDKAIEYFKIADTFGQQEYAQNGFARILKEQGKYDEAIALYEKLVVQFPLSAIISNCYAETLRDAWRIDEALVVYDFAINNLSYDSSCYCGKASVLKSIGFLDEALSFYELARDTSNDSHYIGSGIAEIYKAKGDYERALLEYSKVIKKFPNEVVPRDAKANIYKVKGDLELALKEYQTISSDFPYDLTAKEGMAEVYRDMKDYKTAMALYDEVIKHAPMSERARNGKANVYKCLGKYKNALQAYDENVKDFPYNLVSWSGRADILKLLGELDESIKAYQRISEINPYDKSATYSVAALHVVKGEFDLALKLLPTSPPYTRDEWFAYHVRGMIYMKTGRIQEGIEFYTDALKRVPFYAIANKFRSALIAANLLNQQVQEVPRDLIESIDKNQDEYVKNVLTLHAFGKAGDMRKAEEAYICIEKICPPYILKLRDELASCYLKKLSISHSLEWIYDQECNLILLEAA